nr:PREDICTED: protein pinocchio-like isoform X1 [Bemisia tabaci]XP_018896033.1 PREDICTED: protein pinocchio-like isoform X1 [Bemisia tabaci]
MTTARSLAFTDFEESIVFDIDDPDFENGNVGVTSANHPLPHSHTLTTNLNKVFSFTVGGVSAMSLTSLHPSSSLSDRSQSYNSICSLDELNGYCNPADHVLSIEELRLQLNSCFTCGVSWVDDHVSLDCSECGGYSLERPCPLCSGRCSSVWKRDLTMSHASGRAKWEGKCNLQAEKASDSQLVLKPVALTTSSSDSNLCSRFEKLSASS